MSCHDSHEVIKILKNSLGIGGNNFPTAQGVIFAGLERLRNSGDEQCLFLRAFLEFLSSPTIPVEEDLMFHCITGVRYVLLQSWNQVYSYEFICICRDFFFHLTTTTTGDGAFESKLPRSVFMACQGTAAGLWKRGWSETSSAQRQNEHHQISPLHMSIIGAMKSLIPVLNGSIMQTPQDLMTHLETNFFAAAVSSISLHKTEKAATFLSILMGEFSSTNHTSRYNQPLDFHKRVHSEFETQGALEQCLKLSITAFMNLSNHQQPSPNQISTTIALLTLISDALTWDFGGHLFNTQSIASSTSLLLRAPSTWKHYLIRPDVLNTLFQLLMESTLSVQSQHNSSNDQSKVRHATCHVLISLASLTGPIFSTSSSPTTDEERIAFVQFLLDGCLHVFNHMLQNDASIHNNNDEGGHMIDMCHFLSRLTMNFKVSTMMKLKTSSFQNLLSTIAAVGNKLLQNNLTECRSLQGDIASCIHLEWRQEAFTHLLDAIVSLSDDHCLIFPSSADIQSTQIVNEQLATILAPLYTSYVTCRVEMAKLEEQYFIQNCQDDDEDLLREEIAATQMQEEMTAASSLGRLNLHSSLTALLSSLQPHLLQQMKTLFDSSDTTMSANAAALLEETRLTLLCISHLLTDDNAGETPTIPERVLLSLQLQGDKNISSLITTMMQAVMSLAEMHVWYLTQNPNHVHLSPLLASTLFELFTRWAPAYIMPTNLNNNTNTSSYYWNQYETCKQTIDFLVKIALHHYTYWPQETKVTDAASSLLLGLGRRREREITKLILQSPSFEQLVSLHIITASLRHNAIEGEILESVSKQHHLVSNIIDDVMFQTMIKGYLRIPYSSRASIVTAILVGSSVENDDKANIMIRSSLEGIQTTLSQASEAISNKQVAFDNIHVQETVSLIVELYNGVAQASEISGCHLEILIKFMTTSISPLSGLMTQYAHDLTICTSLLKLFGTYAEQFISLLNCEQSLTLFQASADLLKAYSHQHCISRVIVAPTSKSYEEEQNYTDVLCAIQLLTHLGTKDFIDTCTNSKNVVDTVQVTDVIFLGLQQILPLMTQGLLQYPTLATQFFSLVGFMMDTYPQRVCAIPFQLFRSLLDSLLFGMSHVDSFVAKSSLNGLAGLVREHLKSNALSGHLAQEPDLIENCCSQLFSNVIFQTIIWDRLESAGMALLPLAALDVNKFATLVQNIVMQQHAQQRMQPEQVSRLEMAFSRLMRPEVLSKVSSSGYEGRMNRIRFKKDFEDFIKDIHSFLVIR